MTIQQRNYIVGIDLGSASLGWATIELSSNEPAALLDAGVRIFSPGVDGNLDKGQDESRNLKRREARLHRRQLRRRAARQRELFRLLQAEGLLRAGDTDSKAEESKRRHELLTRLDNELWERWRAKLVNENGVPAAAHTFLYCLRNAATIRRLEKDELGRAFYHLGQRRGFLSNRKAQPRKDEKPGEVAAGITELRAEMTAASARTLAAYFAKVDPRQTKVRRRWTERSMFVEEFERIWETQRQLYPEILTEELRRRIHQLLFYQRPLQDNEKLVGECELEPGEKRAPWATLEAQRFRLLQRLNDMEVEQEDGTLRPLSVAERGAILGKLETEGDQKFSVLRKLIEAGKKTAFNLERGGETLCRGNRTASKMRGVFGGQWDAFAAEQQARIVEAWRKTEQPKALQKIAREKWGLSEEAAAKLSEATPEPGYCRFSRKALLQLLPLLEDGMRLQAAIAQGFGTGFSGGDIYDLLPPVRKALQGLRNPAIERSLTELRKVVNALVREYGKPAAIRVELARDLKKSREERKRIAEDFREREKWRKEAAEKVCAEVGRASRDDIEKYLLAKECRWLCPYTGKPISMHSLFTTPEFQVEHILPLSRFPDNTFQNKTLCHVSANADKAERTPWEAFHGDEQRWAEIVKRVKDFNNAAKLKRFQMTPEETEADKLLAEFSERQLNDTRYASKLAARYLGLLYGGRDEDGKRRVFATSGQVTAVLRRLWGLNGILGLNGEKNREDHRHHAVDAIVIALTSQSVIREMAQRSKLNRDLVEAQKPVRPFKGLQSPWSGFAESVAKVVGAIHVSHRPEHKLSGPLHEETLYGKIYQWNGKDCVNVRKPLSLLTATEVEAVVDDEVRRAVESKLDALGGDIKKLNSINSVQELPYLSSRKGERIPIKSVRIRRTMKPVTIGKGARERRVQPGNNHHVEIFAYREAPGRPERWAGRVVTLLEATDRQRKRQPVIDRKHEGEQYRFVFSLMNGDMVEMQDGSRTGRSLFVVRTVSDGDLDFVRHTEAREIRFLKKGSDPKAEFVRARSFDRLREWNCRKVTVDPLGAVHYVTEAKADDKKLSASAD